MPWRVLALLVGAACCVRAGTARAEARGSTYEQKRVEQALVRAGLALDPAPEGKTIEFIRIEREDVLVENDLLLPIVLPRFAPTWPNAFHWLTEEDTIRRELLLQEGDVYLQSRVDESARNLRALTIFALVRIVAVRGSVPGSVGLLVYTRDLWSLRLETPFEVTAESFTAVAVLSERNLFGADKEISLVVGLAPKTLTLGQGFADPRLFGHKLTLEEDVRLYINRDTKETEGSSATLSLSRPFYDLDERWAWSTTASYTVFVDRDLRGSVVRSVRVMPSGRLVECTQGDDCLRRVWDSRSYYVSASGTHRRGTRYKQSFTIGYTFADAEYEANADTRLDPGQREVFEQYVLPTARRQSYPYVSYGLYLPRYAQFQNLATYGQTETVVEGPSAGMRLNFPLRAFGSSSDSVRITWSSGYLLAAHDSLAQLTLSAGARLENGAVIDQAASMQLRGATPDWFAGRLVARVAWDVRRRDSNKTAVTLGGESGLRGFRDGEFVVYGGSLLQANVEYRTLPLELSSIHIGGVLFYDTGSVYGALREIEMHHGVGVGVRLLFPQFNRYVFRGDLGVPLEGSGFTVRFGFGSAQAVPMTAAEET